MPLITLKNISKSYLVKNFRQKILDDISFEIESGELLAIMGASGSGKSTLLNILGLLDAQDCGEYILDGQKVSNLSEKSKAHFRSENIGFVFQQFNLLKKLNVFKNIELPLLYRNPPLSIDKERNIQKVSKALERVGLGDYISYYPNELSGGQQQRVAIARALINNPKIILADEPTGALDSNTSHEILELFISLQRDGKTIIIVTHDANVASQCHKQIFLKDGKICAGSL